MEIESGEMTEEKLDEESQRYIDQLENGMTNVVDDYK